ncbi:unnamed protein product [Medioppia subpectinata]|uniref:Uncharacterized protein n=2 Tax=Medioppia subpectinata TaxID=1979941 RepID=A0A7R9PVX2_9ACAR|nr:unnamed protein product [Medioppia subpectinata]CAG2102265.1 unnamed protein product [Medioppia subpectinata]
MTSSELDEHLDHLIHITSDEYQYLDSTDNWLTFDSDSTLNANEDITEWIRSAFSSERSRGTHMYLVNKLDEMKVLSPESSASVDTRTFTRNKQRHKRQSLFNGSALSTLCSPVNEDDYSSPETNDRTFEVNHNRSLNGTFVRNNGRDNTFTLPSDVDIQLNNIDDVEKIAKLQEDSLRQSCSNGWSAQHKSPNRSYTLDDHKSPLYSRNNTINTNTLTKSRGHIRQRVPEVMNDYDMNAEEEEAYEDDQYQRYENALSPEVESFGTHLYDHSSTPLVPKNRSINYNQQSIRQPIGQKIMPDVSNLKSHSSYGGSKIGKSEPNLSRRLQPMTRPMAYNNASKMNPMGSRPPQPNPSRSFLESKAPSDSRLTVRNGLGFQNHNHMQTVGRNTSPPPSQSQLILNRKVAVEGELNRVGTTTTTNLCRKSTFRVRDYAINNEDNGSDLCLANGSNASANDPEFQFVVRAQQFRAQ